MDNLVLIVSIAGIFLIVLFTVGLIVARLYVRATKEISYVRTGFGGEKVIMNGGALVFPVLHDTIPVNMNTLRLAVNRKDDQALITRDRMRVDVIAEFYVRTQPTKESIANAAQTLGERTMQPQTLKELVEGKFVDALRSVAAEMTMEELHEKRTDFVQKVQRAVSEDLLKNGLELEAVSLTGLDQTNKSFLNPNNAFDAEGLTRLTQEIEQRRKIRNDIEQETNVQIAAKAMESEKRRLEIARDEEYARMEQQREVEIRRAGQMSEIAKEQAEKKRAAEQAEITAKQEIQQANIAADRRVAEERIEMEQKLREMEIEKNRMIETREIEKLKSIELSEQDRAIAIAVRSKAKSEAQAEADQARSLAVQAEEKVVTSRETEVAERRKQIELILASQEAEREAIGIKVAAATERAATADKASAIRELAQAESDRLRIIAEGEADSEKTRAAAAQIRYTVEAAGQCALNEAANLLSSEQVSLKLKLNLISNLESIIRESVKPMERIDGIKIIQMGGMYGSGDASAAHTGSGNSSGNLADQVVNGALKYRAQAPLLDALLKEVGITGGDINGLTQPLTDEVKLNGIIS
ncbi:MAG: flotillin family protein [Parachlamydiaceae bacterium]|nr:flotillin family protein [Parachlamydiaceae bacterium]